MNVSKLVNWWGTEYLKLQGPSVNDPGQPHGIIIIYQQWTLKWCSLNARCYPIRKGNPTSAPILSNQTWSCGIHQQPRIRDKVTMKHSDRARVVVWWKRNVGCVQRLGIEQVCQTQWYCSHHFFFPCGREPCFLPVSCKLEGCYPSDLEFGEYGHRSYLLKFFLIHIHFLIKAGLGSSLEEKISVETSIPSSSCLSATSSRVHHGSIPLSIMIPNIFFALLGLFTTFTMAFPAQTRTTTAVATATPTSDKLVFCHFMVSKPHNVPSTLEAQN